MSKNLIELPSGQVSAAAQKVSYVKNPLFTEPEKYEIDLTGVAEKVAALTATSDLKEIEELPYDPVKLSVVLKKEAEDNFKKFRYNPNPQERQEGLTKSLELINQAIELNPEGIWQHYDRGLTNMYLGNLTAAVEDFTREIALNDDPQAQDRSRFERAHLNILLKDPESAAIDYQYLKDNAENATFVLEATGWLENFEKKKNKPAGAPKYDPDEIILIKFAIYYAAPLVTLLVAAVAANLFNPNNPNRRLDDPVPQNFRPEIEYLLSIQGFARNMIDSVMDFDYLSEAHKKALLTLSDEKADELFKMISQAEYDAFINGSNLNINFRSSHQNFQTTVGLEIAENVAHPIISEFKKQATKIVQKMLNQFSSRVLEEIPDGEEKDNLQSIFATGLEFLHQLKMISTKEHESGFGYVERNFIYDNMLPNGESHNPLNRRKLQEAVGIFNAEVHKHLTKIRSEVVVENVVEDLLKKVGREIDAIEEVKTNLATPTAVALQNSRGSREA